MSPYRVFKTKKDSLKILTLSEKKILPTLIEAAKKVDKIYLLQENDAYEGANFYPHDASKEEIERAAKTDPKIFSPFTIVERDKSGRLTSIGYFQKYEKLLQPIVKLLDQAAKESKNEAFKNYLERLSRALLTDDYQTDDID